MNIKELHELSNKHSYSCHTSNYYSNESSDRFESFDDFLSEFSDADIDYNLCFRWDIKSRESEYNDEDSKEELENYGKYWAEIFLMQQRKGIFYPITINSFKEEDIPKFLEYLKPHKEYMGQLWNI